MSREREYHNESAHTGNNLLDMDNVPHSIAEAIVDCVGLSSLTWEVVEPLILEELKRIGLSQAKEKNFDDYFNGDPNPTIDDRLATSPHFKKYKRLKGY